MRENVYEDDFDEKVTVLTRHTSEWFKKHQDTELPLRFALYVDESQSGHLRHHFACLVDSSQECMTSVLPVLVNHLATTVSNVVQVSSFRLRPLLSLIVYWLIQFHADKRNGIPGRSEMLSIISSHLPHR